MPSDQWWGYSITYGWVVLDRALPINKPGASAQLLFVRCSDWVEYFEDRIKWDLPEYTFAPNYIKKLKGIAAEQAESHYQALMKEWTQRKLDLIKREKQNHNKNNNNFLKCNEELQEFGLKEFNDPEKIKISAKASHRLISPPVAEIDSLRQPLTPGEKLVFDFFNCYLPEEWEIYLQPYLNGLRPDFVLLHPQNGIAVFEVKDWNLDALNYFVDLSKGNKPRLMGIDGSRTFSLEKQNPVSKVDLYKKEIYDLYCPRLQERAGFGAITAGVIFPFAERNKIIDLLKPFLDSRNMFAYPHLYPLIGADTIAGKDIKAALPRLNSRDSRMSVEIAADLRAWLAEPSFAIDQRSILEISNRQRELIETRTGTGYRRIKGSAGSGKSVVLAARAAELASLGQNVLACTFNITLINYLRDLSVRWKGTLVRNSIAWLNFHSLCKRISIESGYENEYKMLWYEDDHKNVLDDKLADLLLEICSNSNEYQVYDAILVDEGQDFRLKWWQVLRKLLKSNGEMVLVADRTQDVYGTAGVWTEESMINAGFRGPWANLDISYRMPPKLIEVARQFAEFFLPDSLRQIPVSPNLELDMYPCEIKWQQTNSNELVDVTIKAVLEMMCIANPQDRLAVADITIIVDLISVGVEISNKLNDEYLIKCIDTFEKNGSKKEGRRKKLSFFMGDARVKLTTIHSFKGWESRLLILVISKANSHRDLATIYAGLTRLKRSEHGTSNLFIVCSASELEIFASTLQLLNKDLVYLISNK